MFDFVKYRQQYLNNYLQNGYSPIIDSNVPIILTGGDFPRFDIIGIHKLTSDENVGKHNLYIDIIDKNGTRIIDKRVEWGWEGQRPGEISKPIVLDKPPTEPSGNITIWFGQKVWAKVQADHSDKVSNIHTALPDEGSGNTIGHHSFYVVWLYVEDDDFPPTEEPLPDEGCNELKEIMLQLQKENMELKNKINSIKSVLGC